MIVQIRDVVTRNIVGLFGEFKSMIWTERFQEIGDFELITPLSKRAYDLFKLYRYVSIPTSKNMMVVTTIEVGEDEIKITGKSLESILNRREIYEWRDTEKKVYFSSFLNDLFNKAILNPEIEDRKIENISLTIDNSVENPNEISFLTSINRGDKLGDSFYSLCTEFGYGLKAAFDVYTKTISYTIYSGEDKKHITFSKKRFNFKRNTYLESIEDFVSSVLVAGGGEGASRKMITVTRSIKEQVVTESGTETIITNAYRGIERVEGFVDARDIQKSSSESENNYKERLKNRAISNMNEHDKTLSVDGQIRDTTRMSLGTTYGLGDIVTVVDDYFKSHVQIVEIIQSWSSRGYEKYPTFKVVDVLSNEISEEFNIK